MVSLISKKQLIVALPLDKIRRMHGMAWHSLLMYITCKGQYRKMELSMIHNHCFRQIQSLRFEIQLNLLTF